LQAKLNRNSAKSDDIVRMKGLRKGEEWSEGERVKKGLKKKEE
jgi:hypothetical protein